MIPHASGYPQGCAPLPRYRIQTGEPASVTVILAGCGGTGSFAALHLARIAYEMKRQGGPALQLVFVDPDHVEQKNIGRQNFAPGEVGQPKATALASRYNLAFGLQIAVAVKRFGEANLVEQWAKSRGFRSTDLLLVIGCVDSPAARAEIAAAVKGMSRAWWIDAGNDEHSGQVLVGNGSRLEIDPALGCLELPWPSLQEPALVTAPAAAPDDRVLSCAELLALNVQSLMVNQAMAGWLGVYVARLLLSKDLDIYQTWVDLRGGSARSVPVTGEAVVKVAAAEAEAVDEIAPRGYCPECNHPLAEGADVIDAEVGEEDIVFCPACQWRMAEILWDELQQAQREEADADARAAMLAGVRERRALGLVEEAV